MLVDGDLKNKKQSTNGTWFWNGGSLKIIDGLEFKIGGTVFKARLQKPYL